MDLAWGGQEARGPVGRYCDGATWVCERVERVTNGNVTTGA